MSVVKHQQRPVHPHPAQPGPARRRRLPQALSWPVRALLAFVCGASMVLAFAPFGVYPIAVLALALFYQLVQGCQGRGAFGLGWVFGLGLFGFGIFWIRISLNEFGNMAPAIANTLMLLFVAGMALYYGLAAWSIRRLEALLRRRRWVGPLLVLPAVWVLLEWVRGWLFTGFPWLLAGTGQIDGPLAGLAPVVGVHGVSLAVALSAGLLWGSVRWSLQAREADADAGLGLRRAARAAAVSLALLWGGAFGLGQIEWTRVEGAPFQAAIVQGNVEQSLKWHPDGLVPTLEIYLRLTRAVLDSALVVWPETAVPDFLHEVQQVLIEPLAQTARDTDTEIVIGVPIMETRERYYNGLISLGSTSDRYYKRHLVPFGEFLPFKAQLRPLIDWFEVPMSDFSRGSAPAPLLQVGKDEVGVSICYEDVFPDQVRQALPDADYLINVSNDAWFGDSLAPHQHLEQARMRALENGRWLVRATNSGISAFIDHRGRVQGSIPLFERASLTAEIERRAGATPFSRWGSVPALVLAALMLVAALLVGRGRRRGVH